MGQMGRLQDNGGLFATAAPWQVSEIRSARAGVVATACERTRATKPRRTVVVASAPAASALCDGLQIAVVEYFRAAIVLLGGLYGHVVHGHGTASLNCLDKIGRAGVVANKPS